MSAALVVELLSCVRGLSLLPGFEDRKKKEQKKACSMEGLAITGGKVGGERKILGVSFCREEEGSSKLFQCLGRAGCRRGGEKGPHNIWLFVVVCSADRTFLLTIQNFLV